MNSEARNPPFEESVEDVLDSAPCGFISTLPDGTITQVNATFLAWTGYSRVALLAGRRFQDLLTLPGRIFYETHFAPQLRMQGFVKEIACQIKRDGQEPLQGLISSSLKLGPSGEPAVIRTVIFDATDRVRYEEELRRARSSAQHLAAIVTSSSDAIISIGFDDMVRSWNPGATALFGYTEDEAVGRTVDELIVPEKMRPVRLQNFEKLRSGESLVIEDTVRRRKDGSLAQVEITASPMWDADGRVAAASLIFRDISERKRAEEALTQSEAFSWAVFEASPDCLKIIDPAGNLERMNVNGQRCMEIDDFDTMCGLPWSTLWPPENRNKIETALTEALAGRIGRFSGFCPTAKGASKWWDVMVTAIPGEDASKKRLVASSRDMTERKLAEEALRTAEIRYRTLAEATSTIVWRTTPEGDVVFASNAWNEMTGQTDEERSSWGWLDAIHPEDRNRTIERWKHSLETRTLHVNEFRVRTRDGDYRWFNIRGVPIFNDDGSVQEWVGANTDIHDEKTGEEALRISEIRYRRLFEAAHDGVLLLDPVSRKITDANPFMTALLGYTRDQLVGMELYEIGFLADAQNSQDMFQLLKATRQVRYENLPLQNRDGTVREVEVVANLYDEDGRAVIQFNVRDITERRQIEAALREKDHFLQQVTKITPGILQVFDIAEMCSVFINQSVASLLGYAPEEVQAMGKQVVPNLMHPDDLPLFEQHLDRVRTLADGEVAEYEFRMRDREGNWHWFLSHDTVFTRDTTGGARQLIGAASEITERKRGEAALRQSEERLRLVLDGTLAFIGVMERDGTLIEANAPALAAGGLSREDVLNRKLWESDWFNHDPSVIKQIQHAVARALDGALVREDVVVRMRGDTRSTIDFMLSPIRDEEGRVSLLVPSGFDITERKRAETALKQSHDTYLNLIEDNPFGVFLIDSDFRVAQFSAGVQKVFGKIPSLLGRDYAKVVPLLWPEPYASEVVAQFRHTLETGKPYHSNAWGHKRANLEKVESYDWQIKRVIMPNGEFGVVCYFYDTTEIQRYERHIKLLMGEVNHRSKNLLAVVQAMARQTARTSDPSTFAILLSERIRGLAASQDLLVKNQWASVAISDLVEAQLAHFNDMIGTRLLIEGPPAHLSASAAQGIGMALHELATNAAKYGAWSNSSGRIRIYWEVSFADEPLFVMHWLEEGGPEVNAPTRIGFGNRVIERMAEEAVDGKVEIEYRSFGLYWKLTAPSANLLGTMQYG